ncbi:MAG: valine--tRNA ligase [Anaerolineaceae bacterium]|nr:valine--tRNA ligase [Anaerolineaceae bacterium]MBN2676848.1 valine--tRNA ligase [Anaerolineaceae bacterium]
MSKNELPKAYDFKNTEKRLYDWWVERGYFKPSNDPGQPGFDPSIKPFVISIPPANVTGELHLGHAMYVSMEDLMIRYQRMKGVPTLWVPGTDHAGIATQLQVEKDLMRTEEVTREELGREKFVERVWTWKKKYHAIISSQIRRLGASCDWDRERFTLDEGLSVAVREAFVRFYEKGLIYRGPRLINWSPGLKTAVSDLEVEYSEEPGKLYYFKYMLADGSGEFIPVATTRPETILGDTAVAVHPEDTRYLKYVGKQVKVPILGREIPVIADDYVDREFGTGALKITPGHDPNDYQIGQRHKLQVISVLDAIAHITPAGGPYEGMDRFDCRKKIWEDMKKAGLVIKEQAYTLNVPRSQRGGEVIEPMVSTQWFVRMSELAEDALKAVQDGRIRIIPERFTKVYYNWLENIQDWCISRQLWWGHRIPVWYCDDCNEMTVARQDPTACTKCGSRNIHQDPDVLDTWFSSGLWPFSTLGWPDETPDYQYFYPTSVLETGYDILFFWVARMIVDGLELTGKVPFHTVYLHGIIRDEFGDKMSKSKDNVIDPLPLMDELGTDALRFTLLVGSTPGNDINVDVKRVAANRNFANKIWNAGRFVINAINNAPDKPEKAALWSLADSWIWARYKQLLGEVNHLFETWQFGEAGRQIYEFFWSELADWYIEIAKQQLAEGGDRAFYTAQTLSRLLDGCLRLLHPFTPFVTEELWGHLKTAAVAHSDHLTPKGGWPEALIIAPWPEPLPFETWEEGKIAHFTLIMEVVKTIRNLRAEKKVQPGKPITAILVAGLNTSVLLDQAVIIQNLAHLDPKTFQVVEKMTEKPENAVSMVTSGIEIYLPLGDIVDSDSERVRLTRELQTIDSQIKRLETLLGGDFAKKAPPQVVEKERQKLVEYRATSEQLRNQIKS